MLRIRVLLQPLAGGDHQTIWDRPLATRREDALFLGLNLDLNRL